MAVVGVELRGPRVLRPRAVQRVEVQHRRTALEQGRRRDVLAERHLRLVEGEVVVDELTEVGVAGGDRRTGAGPGIRGTDHRLATLSITASLGGRPLGPTLENRNGGTAAGPTAVAAADSVAGPPSS